MEVEEFVVRNQISKYSSKSGQNSTYWVDKFPTQHKAKVYFINRRLWSVSISTLYEKV